MAFNHSSQGSTGSITPSHYLFKNAVVLFDLVPPYTAIDVQTKIKDDNDIRNSGGIKTRVPKGSRTLLTCFANMSLYRYRDVVEPELLSIGSTNRTYKSRFWRPLTTPLGTYVCGEH